MALHIGNFNTSWRTNKPSRHNGSGGARLSSDAIGYNALKEKKRRCLFTFSVLKSPEQTSGGIVGVLRIAV